jgi:hypothetical protein
MTWERLSINQQIAKRVPGHRLCICNEIGFACRAGEGIHVPLLASFDPRNFRIEQL